MLMATEISQIELDLRTAPDLESDPSWEMVARVNDSPHGVLDEWSMSAVFARMDDPASHLYVARLAGGQAAALIARELDGDCYFWFVATAPRPSDEALPVNWPSAAVRRCRLSPHASLSRCTRLWDIGPSVASRPGSSAPTDVQAVGEHLDRSAARSDGPAQDDECRGAQYHRPAEREEQLVDGVEAI